LTLGTRRAYLRDNPVPDQGTIVLYALSTLAQTCAALAAFVGAVGLYRLQVLREQQRSIIDEIHVIIGIARTTADLLLAEAQRRAPDHPRVVELMAEYRRLPDRLTWSRGTLVVFESWNLVLIGVALVGFNHVQVLATWPLTSSAIWLAALGTVSVTGYAVYAWTRG
jgi:hypothetical protein